MTARQHQRPSVASVTVATRSLTRRAVERVRSRGRAATARALRLTAAAVLSYLVARALLPQPRPLTGPLTSLLVVQATLFSTLTMGLRRVAAVVSGVLIAVLVSSFVGLTWWSLGAVIMAALVSGYVLRLREYLLEVPISAMLVLGVGSAQTLATSRVAETLIGAGVGVLLNVVLPPPVRTAGATAAVERVATAAAEVLERVADELPAGVSREQATGWLEEFRRVGRYVDRADRAVNEAVDSRRLNPRAVGTVDAQPILRSGLDVLEHSIVGLRALFRSIADGVPADEEEEQGYDEEVRLAFSVLLDDLADTVRAFGALVSAEARSRSGTPSSEAGAEAALSTTLEALRETRARLTELLMVDAREDTGRWLLRGSLLASVERVLAELDVQEQARRRRRWQEESAIRGRGSEAVARLRDTSRQVARHPRRRPRRR